MSHLLFDFVTFAFAKFIFGFFYDVKYVWIFFLTSSIFGFFWSVTEYLRYVCIYSYVKFIFCGLHNAKMCPALSNILID